MESDGTTQEEISECPLEKRILSSFYACSHILHHRKARRQFGQGRLLRILTIKGKVTQRELQDMMDVRSASLSELLGKMEASGYIERTKNEEDKRNVDVVLTEAGRNAALALTEEHDDAAKQIFQVLDDGEKEQLETILAKLLNSWETDAELSDTSRHHGGHGRGERRRLPGELQNEEGSGHNRSHTKGRGKQKHH